MSTQSLNNLSIDRYRKEAHEILIYNFEQYFYEKRFKLGSGADIKEMSYYRHLYELLCNNNCQVYNMLYDKIAGEYVNYENEQVTLSEIIIRRNNTQNISVDTNTYWTLAQW